MNGGWFDGGDYIAWNWEELNMAAYPKYYGLEHAVLKFMMDSPREFYSVPDIARALQRDYVRVRCAIMNLNGAQWWERRPDLDRVYFEKEWVPKKNKVVAWKVKDESAKSETEDIKE